MKVTELQLRRRPVEKPAAALVIVTPDTGRLIDLLVAAGIADQDPEIYPVAHPLDAERFDDLRAVAFLIPLPATFQPHNLPPCVEFLSSPAPGVFIPRQAVLFPPVTEAECRTLGAGRVQLFHPSLGRHCFTDQDALQLVDLLVAATPEAAQWSTAEVGPAYPPPLCDLRVVVPDAAALLEDEARGDIGREELPPEIRKYLDHGRGDTTPRSSGRLGRWVARMALKIVDRIPVRGSDRTAWNRIEDWALSRLGQAAERLSSYGIGLERLLELLDRDPELGLRHAPPLAGEDDGSGSAASRPLFSDRGLPIFSADRPRGTSGGSRYIEKSYYDRLQRRYRDLANRELQLGRPKRAAYILAELLGDNRGAASTLEQAGFYLEAAALYRDKCNDSAAAADCLERGGLLAEAADLFAQLGQNRRAGQALRRLGQEAAAVSAFTKQVEANLIDRDFVAAAEVLLVDLGEVDEAMESLMFGFESDHNRLACLERWFKVAGEHGRHEQVAAFVSNSQRPEVTARIDTGLAECLVDVARSFPDPSIREEAGDCLRIVVGAAVGAVHASESERDGMLSALGRIDLNDPLLRRDVERFRRSRPTPRRPAKAEPARWNLGQGIPMAGATANDGLLLLVHEPAAQRIRLLSITVLGLRQEAVWNGVDQQVDAFAWVLPTSRIADQVTIAIAARGPRLDLKKRPGAAAVGTPPGLPERIVGLSPAVDGRVAILCHSPDAPDLISDLVWVDQSGRQLLTTPLAEESQIGATPCRLATVATSGRVIRVIDDRLCDLSNGGFLHLPGPCLGLQYLELPEPHSWGVAASLTEGVVLCLADQFGELHDCRVLPAEDHAGPHLAQLGDGRLVVASGSYIDVFDCTAAPVQVVTRRRRDAADRLWGIFAGTGTTQLWEVCHLPDGEIIVRLESL